MDGQTLLSDMEQTDTHIDRGAEPPMVDKMYQLRWVIKLVAFKILFEKPLSDCIVWSYAILSLLK